MRTGDTLRAERRKPKAASGGWRLLEKCSHPPRLSPPILPAQTTRDQKTSRATARRGCFVDRNWKEGKTAASPPDCRSFWPPTTGSVARPINLDLRVRFTLPEAEALIIELIPKPLGINDQHELPFFPPLVDGEGSKRFVLRPDDPQQGLQVVINNRELNLALLGHDLDPEAAPCGRQLAVDRDHGLFMELAKFPELVTIPHLRPGGVSNCGGACGGCGGGGS